jgi:hypothetical protein
MPTTKVPKQHELSLGLYPATHGFGWILFEGPLSPHDWGTAVTRSNKNAASLARIKRIFDRYSPGIVVLEEYDREPLVRDRRIRELCRGIASIADERGIELHTYSRAEVRACFANVGARTRQDIAQAIVSRIDALRARKPPVRRAWMSQDDRMSLFNAAAVVLTHFSKSGDPGAGKVISDRK